GLGERAGARSRDACALAIDGQGSIEHLICRRGRSHMASTSASAGLQLRSTVMKDGVLELSLATVPAPEPKPDEVVVRIEASPITPPDRGLLSGGADLSTAKASGPPDTPVITAQVPPAAMKAMAGRLDQSLPVGNEGAGVVVQAGASPAAQALLGKT